MGCVLALLAPAARAADVNPPFDVTPAAPVGTVLMLHQGGWAGPDRAKQEALMTFPGQVFLDRRWRIVSVDYAAGKAGLQSVLDAVGDELVHPRSDGPLCLYGESAGAHLALLAAARLPSVDCVMAYGAPTDFSAYAQDAATSGNAIELANYEALVRATFGDPGDATAAWEPAKVASRINGDVLMIRQADDAVVPANQVTALERALPVVRTLVTAVGDATDPAQRYLHGTLGDEGRAELAGALGAFADRAVEAGAVARWGREQGCARANSAVGRLSRRAFAQAVACLVSRTREDAGAAPVRAARRVAGGRRLEVSVIGQVTPARVVHGLLGQPAARAALTRRRIARVAVRVAEAERSRATLVVG